MFYGVKGRCQTISRDDRRPYSAKFTALERLSGVNAICTKFTAAVATAAYWMVQLGCTIWLHDLVALLGCTTWLHNLVTQLGQ